ncbi:MAG: DUF4340 domain-containing protein [Clostridia bacterium]|nr:DUF4340 domain-containing protein [Clostridia bacterium]
MVLMLCALVGVFVIYKMAQSMNDAKAENERLEEEAQKQELIIADFNYRDAVALSYTERDGETVSVKISNSRWTYSDDPTLPINQTKIAYMANALASMGAMSVVNLEGADTASFGLDDPAWTFTVAYEHDDGTVSEHTYVYGNYNEFSKAYYFQEVGKDKVYLIVEGLTKYFDYELRELVDAGTFPVLSKERFSSVDITMGDETRNLSGTEAAEAFITISDLLKPSDFAEHHINDETLKKYGLVQPNTTVSFNYKETVTVTDTAGSTSSSTVEQIRSFKIHLGDNFELDGKTYTAYIADGYTFIYFMPVSAADSIRSQFSADLAGDGEA